MSNASVWDKLENGSNKKNHKRIKNKENRANKLASKNKKNGLLGNKKQPTPEDRFLDAFNLSGRQINANKQYINNAKKFSADLIKKATDSEKVMYKYLFYKGIEFEFQKIFYISNGCVIEKFYIADFYFKKAKLIIELDGGYHDTIEQIELDKKRTEALNKLGYKIFRYSNDKTYNMDLLWANVTKYYGNL